MKQTVASRPSAPDCLLGKMGSRETFSRLLLAARAMSETHLQELEDDLVFYEKTGMVGVRMSWMLTLIDDRRSAKVA